MDGHSVLVAEDETPMRSLIRDLLRMEGYRVVEARDAREAIQALDTRRSSDRFDVALVDMTQPHDGLEVLCYLAARQDSTPVIAMSTSRGRLAAAREAGARATLDKPFEIDELLDCVRSVAG